MTLDDDAVARELRRAVRGRVASDVGSRAAYSSDASLYRVPPRAVVHPMHVDDVAAAITVCSAAGVPLVARGAGTSVAGNAISAGVVLDLRGLDEIGDVDAGTRTVTVQPGVVLDALRAAAAPHGLTFGPDPSTHSRCTIGGMLGNNACGAHSVAWGTTAANVESLELLLADGSVIEAGATTADEWRNHCARPDRAGRVYADLEALVAANLHTLRTGFPQLPRRVSGYALDQLLPEQERHVARALVGTEGTCGIVTSATLKLVPLPLARVLLVVGFADVLAAADAVPTLLGFDPLTVESLDGALLGLSRGSGSTKELLPRGGAWLLLEVGATAEGPLDVGPATAASPGLAAALAQARSQAEAMAAAVRGYATGTAVIEAPDGQRALWRLREDGAGLATRLPDGAEAWPGFEDAAVPPGDLSGYLRDLQDLLREHGRRGAVFGHFGEGCLHMRLDFPLHLSGGAQGYREFVEAAADLVVLHGGSISGEHGDGRARSELLAKQYSPTMIRAFAQFKHAFDPAGIFNPGVVVEPAALGADLRITPALTVTSLHHSYPRDDGDLRQAVRRCVGVGRCVSDAPGGTMCPSWRVTKDERHSTRGRARILSEMLDGRLDRAGWRSRDVRDALDLCLSCKGCLSDCPVDVDMATYKSEFLAQHYRRRIRPIAHYSLGWLPVWLRIAARIPGARHAARVVDRVSLLKRLVGLDAGRRLPPLPAKVFRLPPGSGRRGEAGAPTATEALDGRAAGDHRIVLWPDTFGTYLAPEVLHAASRVLTAAGYHVELPSGGVCCAITWISTGQLEHAKRVLRRTAATLDGDDAPIVVTEPSCAAALRHDAATLLPNDAAVSRVAARVMTLAEALEPRTSQLRDRLRPPEATAHDRHRRAAPEGPAGRGSVVVQPHCHQRAVLGVDADSKLLSALGFAPDVLDAGCCGLAGNFGFERGHGDISVRVAQDRLLPALHGTSPGTPVLADGYSCRTQIADLSDRRPVHLAELIDQSLVHSEE